jgi:methylphosphotriester-DNA--protein-cysteine methyltransferase
VLFEHQSAARAAHAAARAGLRCRPELAALMADLLEELDDLRARAGDAGPRRDATSDSMAA